MKQNERFKLLLNWLEELPDASYANIQEASSDASFRRYYRVWNGELSYIVMDAPPLKEDNHRFVRYSELFQRMGLNCPEIIEANYNDGFFVLTDLGSQHYLDCILDDQGMQINLYNDALSELLKLQVNGSKIVREFPSYNHSLLSEEMNLFVDWFCTKELKYIFTKKELSQWEACTQILATNALNQPQVLVHRDYHSRNLIYSQNNNPGILDYQDAVIGPITYDLVSLLRDCYISLSDNLLNDLVLDFYSKIDFSIRENITKQSFIKFFDLMGIQRHLKAVGIFSRLMHRDAKNNYLKDIPRTLNYLYKVSIKYPELSFLTDFVADQCLDYGDQ